MEEPHITS